MIAIQPRASNSLNKVFKFCECFASCGCNKNICQNYLMTAENKKNYRMCITRIQKQHIIMWGIVALEDIKMGAFITEYRGEILTKK